MKLNRKYILLIVLCLEIILLVGTSIYVIKAKTDNVVAQETDFTVIISKDQYYFKNDTMRTDGYIYWVDLNSPGGYLTIYGNTSDMYEIVFWDGIGSMNEGQDYELLPDRIRVYPRTTGLNYRIRSNYYPDYFLDTNFIVIFDTFWAQFSYLTPEGEERFAPVTYHNKQLLPEDAALVSFAPTDNAVIIREGKSFGITWDYVERAMDPFHDPLTYEVTYNFDPIYLQFTEQMFENQSLQQEVEQINNLLDLLQVYFKIIAFIAVAISIIAALYGYLRAKRKFKSKLNEARSMPKKMLKDIEAEIEPRKRVSALFNAFFIILLVSPLFHTNQDIMMEIDIEANNKVVTVEGYTPIITSERDIRYEASIELGKDGIAFETVIMELPFTVDNFSIWADTAEVLEFRAYNEFHSPLSYQQFSDKYLIRNLQGFIEYEIVRPYTYYNNSNILVYLDYFWLLFVDPELQVEGQPPVYSKADIEYTIIAPEGAILYSASPESILTLSQTPEGRRKVTFTQQDREIDPYHDLFSTQLTYSFIDVIEAIENQSARFEHFRVDIEINEEQRASLNRNLIFISLLGLIAPILAFLLTYFIIRRRMLRKIQEEEQKYEMLVSVEEIQLQAMNKAREIDVSTEPWKAMLGEYWELLGYLSRIVPVNLLAAPEELHEKTVRKYVPSNLIAETLEVLSVGSAISSSWISNEQIYYNKQQARDYLESVMKLIEKIEKWRKEQT
jgi:hypothetical protein